MVRKFNGFTLSSSRGLALGKRCGFTLAETMIVIVVLGIIATLTIPALVNKNKESVAKTKVRKAMAAYESALNKMIIENDLKSHETLTAWAGNAENGCTNSTNYFKKVQGDGCIFKTSDGIWWNISDIERPLIAFNQDNLTIDKANNANDKTAFVLVGRFGSDGSLRVDDLAYETANSIKDNYNNESKAQVEKLYTLLGMKKASTYEICDWACQFEKAKNTQCIGNCPYNGTKFSNCMSCVRIAGNSAEYYNEKGSLIAYFSGCSNGKNCSYSEKYTRDENGDIEFMTSGCNGNLENCSQHWKNLGYDETEYTELWASCNEDFSVCEGSYVLGH